MPPSRPCSQLLSWMTFETCRCVGGAWVHANFGSGGRRSSAAQVGPDHATHLHRGIGRGTDLVGEAELLGLVHHVHAPAVDVELPAVVHAAQAAVLVAAEEERHPPVRAVLLEQADLAPAVAEGHQLLAQELDAHRWAIGLRQLPRQERRHPVPAHRGAHGGAGADTGRSLVVVVCQHDLASSVGRRASRADRGARARGYGFLSFISSREGKGTRGIESSACSARRGPTPRSVR